MPCGVGVFSSSGFCTHAVEALPITWGFGWTGGGIPLLSVVNGVLELSAWGILVIYLRRQWKIARAGSQETQSYAIYGLKTQSYAIFPAYSKLLGALAFASFFQGFVNILFGNRGIVVMYPSVLESGLTLVLRYHRIG